MESRLRFSGGSEVDGSRMGRVLRRALGGLLVFGLLVTALAYYTYSPYLMMPMPAGPPTTAEPALEPDGRLRRTRPPPTSAPQLPRLPTLTCHPDDPGGRDPGIRLVAAVGQDQVFEVTETVRLPEPVTSLTLLPPDLSAAGGDLRSARPVATEVKVRVNDRTVRPRPDGAARDDRDTCGEPTDRFEVRYRLQRSHRSQRAVLGGTGDRRGRARW